MSKPLRFLLLVTVMILLAGIIVSGSLSSRPRENSEPEEQTQSVQIIDDAQQLQTPEASPVKEYDTADMLPNSFLEPLKRDAEAAMLCLREVYESIDKGSSINVVLSDDSVAELVNTLGANGYSAIDYFGSFDMQNPQAIIDFGTAVNSGTNAQATYYTVHNDGRMHANILSYENGSCSVIMISMEWDKSMKPRIYSVGQYAVKDIRLTDKGWLICNRDVSGFDTEKKLGADSHTFVRLYEYDEEKRQLAEKYLGKAPYAENNLFTCTWSSNNFGELDFNSLFPILYGQYYGSEPLVHGNAKLLGGFESIDGTGLHIIPYEQFERVIGSFFEINSDSLRYRADNNSEYGGYYMLGAQDSYYSSLNHQPFPEIVSYWKNADGTLTLKIDAVYPWYGTDRAFTHELTVKDTEDGFKYISNYVYDSSERVFPAMLLIGERKFQIGQLGR